MRVTDQEIVAALLATRTNADAAEALEISERTLYNRMSSESFKKLYRDAQRQVYELCLQQVKRNLLSSVDTMVEIMNDVTAPAQTRLNAAEALQKSAARMTQSASDVYVENYFSMLRNG